MYVCKYAYVLTLVLSVFAFVDRNGAIDARVELRAFTIVAVIDRVVDVVNAQRRTVGIRGMVAKVGRRRHVAVAVDTDRIVMTHQIAIATGNGSGGNLAAAAMQQEQQESQGKRHDDDGDDNDQVE